MADPKDSKAECEIRIAAESDAPSLAKLRSESEYFIYLTDLYVREEFRGQGIGSMLLSAAVAWANTNDVHSVILAPTERSRPLYARHGFSDGHNLLQLPITVGRKLNLS